MAMATMTATATTAPAEGSLSCGRDCACSAGVGCMCVAWTPRERCEAIQLLVRPDEVRGVVEPVPLAMLGRETQAERVAAWLRARFDDGTLDYIPDPDDCDRWCPPGITIAQGGGDCDDLAILAVSLLGAGGVDGDFVVGHYCSWFACFGHAWVEGFDESGWFLLEPTTGWLSREARPHGYHASLLLRPGMCRMAA